jgi:hypothetical protein
MVALWALLKTPHYRENHFIIDEQGIIPILVGEINRR